MPDGQSAAIAALSRRAGSRVEAHVRSAQEEPSGAFWCRRHMECGLQKARYPLHHWKFWLRRNAVGQRAEKVCWLIVCIQRDHACRSAPQYLYRPYRLHRAANGLHCFFRDDRLSDLIGFEYSRWNGKDAALHFVAQLESHCGTGSRR